MVGVDYRDHRIVRPLKFYRNKLKELALERPYLNEVPYNCKDEAIRDAMANIKSIRSNGHGQHAYPVRSKKKNQQVISIRSQNITDDLKIFPRMLFNKEFEERDVQMWDRAHFTPDVKWQHFEPRKTSKWTQKLNVRGSNLVLERDYRDSKMIWKKKTDDWFLCLVTTSNKDATSDAMKICTVKNGEGNCENQATTDLLNVVSIDPGQRTFLTWYAPKYGMGKIGNMDSNKLIKICLNMDRLCSLQTKVSCRKRQKLGKVIARLRRRFENLRLDAHTKICSWLTKTFDTIVIPPFNAHLMSKRGERVIRSKTVRGLMNWAHGMFRQRLRTMCLSRGKTYVEQNEAYTSKTCSNCGWIHDKLGGREWFVCQNESDDKRTYIDRDVNGARGILLRALLGGSQGSTGT